ncbi:MAG TPA: glycosyltransferase [Bacteroidales bacterium]|nr:glycosyltransferase [Bacteroidales bacterium]HNS46165.1 glycosyltransferase [Bacteroidales bacterium]
MTILAVISWVFLAIRFCVALANLLQRQWLRSASPGVTPLVSILIPARNEEKNIRYLLESIRHQDYPSFEVIVYDDESVDSTAGIVRQYTDQDPRFSLIKGIRKPAGWLGKNHACHQLATKARGEYLLFLDADVEIGKNLISNALAHLLQKRLKLFSLFPQQTMVSWGERITVPIMNYILVSLLPLSMIKNSHRPSFAAANGQFMLFDAEVYRKHWFHHAVRQKMVEDILIMKLMKKMRYRVHTLLSNGQIRCRMYSDFREAVQGFSRNVLEYFGGHILTMLLFALLTVCGFIFVFFGLPPEWFIAYLGLNLFLSVIVSLVSRQPVFKNLVLLPVQKVVFLWIGFLAVKNRWSGVWYWKDRKIEE